MVMLFGCAQARSFEARHWRTLQKDIEYKNTHGRYIASVTYATGKVFEILS